MFYERIPVHLPMFQTTVLLDVVTFVEPAEPSVGFAETETVELVTLHGPEVEIPRDTWSYFLPRILEEIDKRNANDNE